jgi:hypothetical protein
MDPRRASGYALAVVETRPPATRAASVARALGVIALTLAAIQTSCGKSNETCDTTQDCIRRGDTGASCINGRCAFPCVEDTDCVGLSTGNALTNPDLPQRATQGLVCEAGQCVSGCAANVAPEVCAAGEKCLSGRCAAYAESFEAARLGAPVLLASRGFGALCFGGEADGACVDLENKATRVMWRGENDCSTAGREELCAGVAADGVYFVSLERQTTPERPTRAQGDGCLPCRCCLACTDPSYRRSGETSCGGATFPDVNSCQATPPAACAAVCEACAACPALPAVEVGIGLSSCEARVASYTCAPCAAERACLERSNGIPMACVAETNACQVCERARQLQEQSPDDPPLWAADKAACDAQGNAGCYKVPVALQRNALTDDEQALTSPAIDLSAATASLVLELQYVPFDVGDTWRPVLQGQPRETWPSEPQRVRVQLCGADCARPASWVDAAGLDGAPIALPTDEERRNRLQFQLQSPGDWRSGRLVVAIPDALRTSTFHYRLVPRLADGVRVGVDAIRIRRRR